MFSARYSREAILSRLSQEQIMSFYTGVDIDKKTFHSPFRKDEHPSCSYWVSNNDTLYLKDWSTGHIYDCFQAASMKTQLKDGRLYEHILDNEEAILKQPRKQLEKNNFLEYKVLLNNEFSDSELEWWGKYKIDKELLKTNHVFSARAIGINGNPAYRSTKTNPIYVYSIPLTSRIRIYRPLAAKDKK
jgi:hypothetical protein